MRLGLAGASSCLVLRTAGRDRAHLGLIKGRVTLRRVHLSQGRQNHRFCAATGTEATAYAEEGIVALAVDNRCTRIRTGVPWGLLTQRAQPIGHRREGCVIR